MWFNKNIEIIRQTSVAENINAVTRRKIVNNLVGLRSYSLSSQVNNTISRITKRNKMEFIILNIILASS
jgi:hypothetical protein